MKTTKEDFEKAIIESKETVWYKGRQYQEVNEKEAAAACYELAKQMQPKWIPVKASLPTEYKRYLCYALIKDSFIEEVCLFDPDNGAWIYEHRRVMVSHYQPLPEPPTI